MELIENKLQTALKIAFVASFILIIVLTIAFAIISLIQDPAAANSASWGFAD